MYGNSFGQRKHKNQFTVQIPNCHPNLQNPAWVYRTSPDRSKLNRYQNHRNQKIRKKRPMKSDLGSTKRVATPATQKGDTKNFHSIAMLLDWELQKAKQMVQICGNHKWSHKSARIFFCVDFFGLSISK